MSFQETASDNCLLCKPRDPETVYAVSHSILTLELPETCITHISYIRDGVVFLDEKLKKGGEKREKKGDISAQAGHTPKKKPTCVLVDDGSRAWGWEVTSHRTPGCGLL